MSSSMPPSASGSATMTATASSSSVNIDTKVAAVDASYGPNVHISAHPVLQHKISVLRSSTTSQATFHSTLKSITYHLGYEATSNLKTKEIPISVTMAKNDMTQADCTGFKIKDRVALIPILRSGLGMADGMMELLPKASVHHIGMYHLPGSDAPVQYFNRIPKKCDADIAYVVDPIIGTAGTMMAVIANLKKVRKLITCCCYFHD